MNITFQDYLRSERKRLGLSLAQLASALDVGPRTIDHWISGTREPLVIAQEGARARLEKLKSKKP